MEKILDKLEKIMINILAIIFGIMVFAIFYQIVLRAFSKTNVWSEEITRYLFVWLSMLGSAVALRRGSHMQVDILIDLFPDKVKNAIEFLTNTLVIAFFLLIIIYGSNLVAMTYKQSSAGLGIPMSYPYLALPVGGALMLLFTIEAIIKKHKIKKDNSIMRRGV